MNTNSVSDEENIYIFNSKLELDSQHTSKEYEDNVKNNWPLVGTIEGLSGKSVGIICGAKTEFDAKQIIAKYYLVTIKDLVGYGIEEASYNLSKSNDDLTFNEFINNLEKNFPEVLL